MGHRSAGNLRYALLCGLLLGDLLLAGCGRGKPAERPVGGDLPTAAPTSVALPGATDAADVPHAPAVAEGHNALMTAWSDPATGVQFHYPSAWRPANAAMGVPAPDFTAVAGAPRITQVFLPKGTGFAPTVLTSLSFSYALVRHADAGSCAALPARALQHPAGSSHTATYNGITYTEAQGSDAGMCHQLAATIDTTLRGDACLVFERDLATVCPDVKSSTLPRPLTPAENALVEGQLAAIMASVSIVPAQPSR